MIGLKIAEQSSVRSFILYHHQHREMVKKKKKAMGFGIVASDLLNMADHAIQRSFQMTTGEKK